VILVFELTGSYGLVLPLMLAAALATLIADRIHPESAYTMSLARKGIRLPKSEDIDLLDTVDVEEVMSEVDAVATPGMSMEEFEEVLDHTRHHGMPVVSDRDLVGVISVTDLERVAGRETETTVGEEMSPHPITVTPDLPVSVALARMASLGLGASRWWPMMLHSAWSECSDASRSCGPITTLSDWLPGASSTATARVSETSREPGSSKR